MTTTVGPIWNNQMSSLDRISSFNKISVPCAKAWIIPQGRAYLGPIHCCIPIDIFLLSHTNTNISIVNLNIRVRMGKII